MARTKTSRAATKPRIGIIGGSGLYEMEGFKAQRRVRVRTPFGAPSDAVTIGSLNGVEVAFLARHGAGHRHSPTQIPYRANIHAMKQLGVERILSVSAVGSMKETIHPGELLIPDQFYDHTKHRVSTFFDNGIVAHVAFGDPVCPELTVALAGACRGQGFPMHQGGTYLCMEGPQFSTRGESLIYRQWGVDVIGMTNATEAKLAREAEICYATMALVTDYDCWHATEAEVSVETVIEYLHKNAKTAAAIIRRVIPELAARERKCQCGSALRFALLTDPSRVPDRVKADLAPIVGKYLKS